MNKAPIKYFGGKGMMLKTLQKFFPPDSEFDVFVEPFCGSSVVAINIKDKPIIINDLNKNIYSLFKVMSDPDQSAEFKSRVDIVPYHEDVRVEYRNKLKKNDLSDMDRAVAFFIVNRLSHNGQGGISVNPLKRRDTSKSVADFTHGKEMLEKLFPVYYKAIVLNRDGVELIEKYDRKRHFIYCDPPYHQDTRTAARYDVDMDNETHERFVKVLMGIQHAKVAVSGYDHPVYAPLLENGWFKYDFDVKTVDGVHRPKTKTEIVWTNYEVKDL